MCSILVPAAPALSCLAHVLQPFFFFFHSRPCALASYFALRLRQPCPFFFCQFFVVFAAGGLQLQQTGIPESLCEMCSTDGNGSALPRSFISCPSGPIIKTPGTATTTAGFFCQPAQPEKKQKNQKNADAMQRLLMIAADPPARAVGRHGTARQQKEQQKQKLPLL